jgi:hypothetical protein
MCAKTSELRSVCDVSVFAPSVLHETEEDKNGVASGQVPLINVCTQINAPVKNHVK